MRRLILLIALFAAGIVASYALASPPPGHHDATSSTSTSDHGKAGDHGSAKCHPVNFKGTVSGGTIALGVTKASGHSSQLQGTTANLKVDGQVSVQAWSCGSTGSNASSAPQTFFLRQLHVGGKPGGTATTTTANP